MAEPYFRIVCKVVFHNALNDSEVKTNFFVCFVKEMMMLVIF
jgi:hypothetical protein